MEDAGAPGAAEAGGGGRQVSAAATRPRRRSAALARGRARPGGLQHLGGAALRRPAPARRRAGAGGHPGARRPRLHDAPAARATAPSATARGRRASGIDPPPRDLRLGVVAFGSAPGRQPVARRGRGPRRARRPGRHRHARLDRRLRRGPRRHRPVPEDPGAALRRRGARAGRGGQRPTRGPDAGAAAARGRLVYHALGRCQACHPAYAAPAEIAAMAAAAGTRCEPRPDAGRPRLVPSDFGRAIAATDFRARSAPRGAAGPPRARTSTAPSRRGSAAPACPPGRGRSRRPTSGRMVHYLEALAPRGR